ncbi:torsin family 4, member Ab isoform X2 [Denticeps clupeoides]|uniref:AAA+ ATPase domain-containing protein n=1 Tax=Denticeps clupeoides TaxID=299321 RepID=A0AAY4BTA4_9TELE|nr:torsin-4A-like isoform X2 [Denticeps clupeoides]
MVTPGAFAKMKETPLSAIHLDSPADGHMEEEKEDIEEPLPPSPSIFSPQMKAIMRIKNKYQSIKKRRMDGLAPAGKSATPENFTDKVLQRNGLRRKRKKPTGVLFPSTNRKIVPKNCDRSQAKVFLILFSVIVFLQVYNAIENLDDHIVKYDLEGLEKTLRREVFGQKRAMEDLMEILLDYLSTYSHNKPLALSVHGPSGVGKSHLGRLLANHFRSMVGEDLVVQYFTLHNCPLQENAGQCASELAAHMAELAARAEDEEQIPLIVLDEVELMQPPMLDVLHQLLQPEQSNECLNVIYVLLSSLGQEEIIRHALKNSSTSSELGALLQNKLSEQHPLWAEVKVVPMTLLEKSHVVECFLEEMTEEGFYADMSHIERLAGELSYYSDGDKKYSQNGCKQVVAKVNLL